MVCANKAYTPFCGASYFNKFKQHFFLDVWPWPNFEVFMLNLHAVRINNFLRV
jgi:hypothetical protein